MLMLIVILYAVIGLIALNYACNRARRKRSTFRSLDFSERWTNVYLSVLVFLALLGGFLDSQGVTDEHVYQLGRQILSLF